LAGRKPFVILDIRLIGESMNPRRTLILNLLGLILGCCSCLSGRTAMTDRAVETPFELYRDSILVPVKVDGKGPFSMLLDTGVNPSGVDLKVAKEVGLKLASEGAQATGGGADQNLAYETRFPVLEVGGLTEKNIETLAIDLSKTSAALGKPIHGVLGYSFLVRRIVQIDYPKRIARFYTASPFRDAAKPPSKRTTLTFRFHDHILLDGVVVNGKRITANLDTGSNSGFQIAPAAVAALGLEADAERGASSQSVGINGLTLNHDGKVKSIGIGTIQVDNPSVVFYGKGSGHDDEPWGIRIGNAFLKDFVVTIDFQSNTITLERP
jgi:predicted aspartyl protease